MTKIKICGITNKEDAAFCAKVGADLLGLVFYKKSPRFIAPDEAAKIIADLPTHVLKVGVFVNEAPAAVHEIAKECGLDLLQFHGDESPEYLRGFEIARTIKAFRVKNSASLNRCGLYHAGMFLFDTFKKESFGGTGETFEWSLLEPFDRLKIPYFVSGGLTPENVREAIKNIHPFAVDVSSGVESAPGRKDHRRVEEFIAALRAADKK